MLPLQKILCPVDFSEATKFAIVPAVSLAAEHGAELLVLHVLKYPYPYVGALAGHVDVDNYYDTVEAEAHRRLPELVAAAEQASVACRSIVVRGIPDEAIAELAGEEAVDLIILPTHARTGAEHWLLGSVAEKVVRLAPCPVLTVSPRQQEPAPLRPSTILFATDFSEYANSALPQAAELARHYGADLVMAHVITVWNDDPANPEWRFPELPDEHREAIEAGVQQQLDEAAERIPTDDIEVRTKHVRGFDPGLDLLRAAQEEGADLVVIATHGRLGLAHMLIGSTAEKVIRYAPCPVLSLKPAQD